MTDEVKACFTVREQYFHEYFIVPPDMQGPVDEFIKQAAALGEDCASAGEFEERFVSTGLSDMFSGLLTKCVPKARKMTREEKKAALKTTKDILLQSKSDIAQYAAESIATSVRVEVSGEVATRIREQRIADGTAADYTIRRNAIDDAGRALAFLGRLFGKK